MKRAYESERGTYLETSVNITEKDRKRSKTAAEFQRWYIVSKKEADEMKSLLFYTFQNSCLSVDTLHMR